MPLVRAAGAAGRGPAARWPAFSDATDHARASHAYGKSYLDVVRAFRGRFDHAPDFVARASDEARRRGGARVGGGRRRGGHPVRRRDERRSAASSRASTARRSALDLGALDRVLEVDDVSRAARIQAGATGPRLEEQLGEHGMTLRFFPQSFELSTLGGWIATRAGGHFATRLTHIDDLVESVRAVTPSGRVGVAAAAGQSGAGPSPDRMLLGLRGHPRRDHRGVGARAAAAASAALRAAVRFARLRRRG